MTIGAFFMLMCVLLQIFVLRKDPFYIYHLDWNVATKERQMKEDQEASDYGLYRMTELPAPTSIAITPKKESLESFFKVAKTNFSSTQGLLYALLFSFIVTFIVFPAIAFDTSLKMMDSLSNSEGWFVLFINTVFSIFDTVGRKVGGLKAFDLSYTGVKILTVARLLFVVTFYLIAFQKLGFNSDWFIIVNMIAFAFTNGYQSTLCAVKAPGTVSPDLRG
jgi:hypothetical protein